MLRPFHVGCELTR